MTFSISIDDMDRLAELLAPRLAALMPKHVCNFSADDVSTLKSTASNSRLFRVTALTSSVGILALTTLSLIGWGIIVLIKRGLEKV